MNLYRPIVVGLSGQMLSASEVSWLHELQPYGVILFSRNIENKTQLKALLTDEIIKRYFYSEGLYSYYKANNPDIKKGLSILNNPEQYSSILR